MPYIPVVAFITIAAVVTAASYFLPPVILTTFSYPDQARAYIRPIAAGVVFLCWIIAPCLSFNETVYIPLRRSIALIAYIAFILLSVLYYYLSLLSY